MKNKHRIFLIPLTFFFITFFFSCKTDTMKDKISNLLTTKLILPSDSCNKDSAYLICRYVKPISCTSCELHLGQWRVYKRKLRKKLGKYAKIQFIIETKDPQQVRDVAEMHNFQDIITIDSTSVFIKDNPTVASIGNDVVMLIDKDNNVIAVGDPSENVKIDSLYTNIILDGILK